jgi:protein-S-isoprenylcysteine O-methyltransferase Ste14
MLVHRALLLKRSSGALFLAILFFVLASLGIGLFSLSESIGTILAVVFFIVGMISLLLGILYAYWEIRISHQTIVEEIRETAEVIKKDLEG